MFLSRDHPANFALVLHHLTSVTATNNCCIRTQTAGFDRKLCAQEARPDSAAQPTLKIDQIPRRCRSRSPYPVIPHQSFIFTFTFVSPLLNSPGTYTTHTRHSTSFILFFLSFIIASSPWTHSPQYTPPLLLHFSPSSWLWNSPSWGQQLAPWPVLPWRPHPWRQIAACQSACRASTV